MAFLAAAAGGKEIRQRGGAMRNQSPPGQTPDQTPGQSPGQPAGQKKSAASKGKPPVFETATFAGGCFWCAEADFEKLKGVQKAVSGFSGGSEPSPTYKQVSSGATGHVEAVQVVFDPKKISYRQLLDAFWRMIDPTDSGGQFVDQGRQYTTAIFYHNEAQKAAAEESRAELQAKGPFKEKIATPIRRFEGFFRAEEYHQDYYKRNLVSSAKYKYYRSRSGRDQFLRKTWESFKDFRPPPPFKEKAKKAKKAKKAPPAAAKIPAPAAGGDKKNPAPAKAAPSGRAPAQSAASSESPAAAAGAGGGAERRVYSKPPLKEIKSRLTALQYRVTQEDATEPPFKNRHWDNKSPGIYVDIVSGEPLFSSLDKYDSKTGWPSFTKPLIPENILEREDKKLFARRTEIRSRHGDSHLGHVFPDGPPPLGLRYCVNSAAVRFIPKADLKKEGYGALASLF